MRTNNDVRLNSQYIDLINTLCDLVVSMFREDYDAII